MSNETLSGVEEDTQKTRKPGDSISGNFIFNHKAESKGETFDAVSLEKKNEGATARVGKSFFEIRSVKGGEDWQA